MKCLTLYNYSTVYIHLRLISILFKLAKYCDLVLKKSTKNLTDAELDEKLSEVVSNTMDAYIKLITIVHLCKKFKNVILYQQIIIFKYIDDKDIFQKV